MQLFPRHLFCFNPAMPTHVGKYCTCGFGQKTRKRDQSGEPWCKAKKDASLRGRVKSRVIVAERRRSEHKEILGLLAVVNATPPRRRITNKTSALHLAATSLKASFAGKSQRQVPELSKDVNQPDVGWKVAYEALAKQHEAIKVELHEERRVTRRLKHQVDSLRDSFEYLQAAGRSGCAVRETAKFVVERIRELQ
jgi:hypothetical protein